MKTDKNTVIGIVLLGILFFVFFWYNNKEQQAYMDSQKHIADSIAAVEAKKHKPADKQAAILDSIRNDSLARTVKAGNFTGSTTGTEQIITVENDLMKVNFTTKGGRVKNVVLKNFTSHDGKNVVLGGTDKDVISYTINTGANNAASTSELFFTSSGIVKNNDGSQSIKFALADSAGTALVHEYIIKKDSYLIDWNIDANNASHLFTGNALNINYKAQPVQHEGSVDYERRVANVCFSEGNEFDYISAHTDHTFEKPAQWISSVQQFFNTTLITKYKDGFSGGKINWARFADSSDIMGTVDASLQMKLPATASVNIPMQLYYGPNDYKILGTTAPEMDKIINLGRDMYSFVRPINKYLIMPVFNFFAGFISTYGWVVALLTIFIRLITSPLTYRSYKSGAKMKLVRPELDALRKKFGDDQQGFAMEQMKLFREMGVNPLGGCMPMLLQIPIFFALYSFFNSNIALRGQSFLWSKDLSTFDNILHWNANLWIIGNHLSIFALLAVVTSFLISMYNMSMTPSDPNNPAMKYMPYIYPPMMLIFFNGLPAALTWYYTVSNVITLGIQFVIQNYILDHDKLLASMKEKKAAPKTKSKWQEQYEKMMDSQKKIQEMKDKTKKK